jgi:sec-independent protein translocase protein TatC
MSEATTEDESMSFWSHLDELRRRLIFSVVSTIVLSIPCGIYWEKIFDLIMVWPLRFTDPRPRLIFTAPAEAILLSIKIAIASGVVAASPVIFFQLWKFVAPGLFPNEKKIILPAAIFSTIAFASGISFCYTLLPYILKVLTAIGTGRLEAMFTSANYLGFFLKLMLAFGIIFELPVVSFVLSKLGLITPSFLISKTKYALVVSFILGALLTPPDIISQIVLALPLMLLYGISILVSFIAQPKKKTTDD